MTPRTNGTALKNFAVAKYRFHLTVTEQITLPPYKGSAFHGGFGHALKQLSPSFYDYFYPPPGRGDLPRPYVLIPPQRHASTTHPARPCNLDSPSSAPPPPTFPSSSPPSPQDPKSTRLNSQQPDKSRFASLAWKKKKHIYRTYSLPVS